MFWGLRICKENVVRKALWEIRCEKDVVGKTYREIRIEKYVVRKTLWEGHCEKDVVRKTILRWILMKFKFDFLSFFFQFSTAVEVSEDLISFTYLLVIVDFADLIRTLVRNWWKPERILYNKKFQYVYWSFLNHFLVYVRH